jgi:RND family efflux transporter MFP subunit
MTRKKWILAAVFLVAVSWIAWRWFGRSTMEADDPDHSVATSAVAPAAVARVERHSIGNTLTIAGEFKAFQDVDVHAKVAGYIRKIYVDVGDHVKQGQTLAELEVPELAAQLSGADAAVRAAQEQIRRAQGGLQRVQSSHAAAHSAYARLKQAADSRAGLVAQQEIDDSQAKDLESEAQVQGAEAELSGAKQQLEMAEANRKQYEALSNYTHIMAPFAGVVTHRFADTGALVAAGTSSSTQAIPVVRLAQISVLRLVLPIPESVAAQVRLGEAVKVRVQALDRDFQGKVSRFADSLDPQTRTMETEIDVDNRDGRLMPGMYTETRLSLREKENALTIPLQGVTRNGEDATVLAVDAHNVVEERHVRLGLEDAERVEVVSGLADGDRVIIGNRSGFRNGQKIQPKEFSAAGSKTGSEN